MALLFPCALIESFTGGRLTSTITVEEENKWSTTNAELTPSFDYHNIYNDRRSMKLVYNTTSRRYVIRGDDGEYVDHLSWNNPFGTDVDYPHADGSWATNMGMWIYTTTHTHSGGASNDETMFQMGYQEVGGSGWTNGVWNSSVGETGKWVWFDDIVNMSNVDIERFMISIDKSSASSIYINTFTLFKRSTSNSIVYDASDEGSTTSATGEYNWGNGLKFHLTSLNPTRNGYSITGKIEGNDYKEVIYQLKQMETIAPIRQDILRRPMPKFSNVQDYGYVKTYLFMVENQDPFYTENKELYIDPIIITGLKFTNVAGKPHSVNFSARLEKFTGV